MLVTASADRPTRPASTSSVGMSPVSVRPKYQGPSGGMPPCIAYRPEPMLSSPRTSTP
jgi:hypothetical protein